jgi:DNA-binding protein HU-beta
MNKSELIAKMAEKGELSKKDAEKALNAFVDVVNETLAKGEKVQLIGFGTFDVKSRAARVARNPRTGAELKIAASKAPAFKPGKALKDKVNTPAKKKGKK